ncbi:hypothetical protein WLF18_18550 [Pseudomonas shirazensis]|uniref:Uncharacterized protein n=1 Tax=Pseudomonas shirazensis TaxID=2745494 RepID=A0ABU9A4Y1_9PSED
MNRFGRAVLRGAGALLITLSVGTAWGSEFSDKAERVFTSIDSVSETGATGKVLLKVPERGPTYYETGDKAHKIFAIDSVRVFRDVPKLERLMVTIPREGKTQTLDVTRAQVEQYYKISLSDLAPHTSKWREEFIQRYDNKQSRADFVKKFVTEK